MAVSFPMAEVMTRQPYVIEQEISVVEASRMMKRFGIRHLPVCHLGALVGIISDRNLKMAMAFPPSAGLKAGDVMTLEPFVCELGDSVKDVVNEMANRKIGSAVVINAQKDIVGIFTEIDAMRLLTQVLEAPSKGGN